MRFFDEVTEVTSREIGAVVPGELSDARARAHDAQLPIRDESEGGLAVREGTSLAQERRNLPACRGA